MKYLFSVLFFTVLTSSLAQAELNGMKIFNLCKNEGIEEACRYKTLQNEINEVKSDCNATFIMPAKKKEACDKLKALEKEHTINLQKLKCDQGEASGEECENLNEE